MNKFVFIFILCTITTGLFCENLSDYPIEKVKIIPSGKEKGLIGWEPAVAGGFSGPTAFAVANNYFYVPDSVNNRLDVYDNNFTYLKSITDTDNVIPFATSMDADENGNIVIFITGFGLKRVKADGSTIFTIKYDNLSYQVKQLYNFFLINSEVFIYDDNDDVAYVTDKGQIIKSSDALNKLKSLSSVNLKSISNQTFSLPADKKAVINKFAVNSKFMIRDEDYFSSQFDKNKEYFNKIKDVKDYIRAQKEKLAGTKIKDKTNDINLFKWSMFLIGYDNDHNGYWRGIQPGATQGFDKEAIVVFSKYGELLDAFYYSQNDNGKANYALFPTTNAVLAVAPSGDVYFLVGNEKEYTFYKVTRRW